MLQLDAVDAFTLILNVALMILMLVGAALALANYRCWLMHWWTYGWQSKGAELSGETVCIIASMNRSDSGLYRYERQCRCGARQYYNGITRRWHPVPGPAHGKF